MPRSKIALIALALALTLQGCGKDEEPAKTVSPVNNEDNWLGPDVSPRSSATRVGNIYFDAALDTRERAAMETAMSYLDVHALENADPLLLNYMKISRGDRQTVRRWIEDRVQYIVSDNSSQSKLDALGEPYSFANPGIFPPRVKQGGANAMTIMSNDGAVLYLYGKMKGRVFSYLGDGIGRIRFTSPRSGLLTIGEGLFKLAPSAEETFVRIEHLLTLIHEARHSDGNRETTGFLHEICPSGTYKGEPACDKNLNGPYGIEALAFKALKNSCTDCKSARTRALIDFYYADSLTRTLPGSAIWDDAPEGHRE